MKNGVAVYGGFAGTEDPEVFNLADRDFENNETILSGYSPAPHLPPSLHYVYHVFYHPEGTDLDETAILDGFTISRARADDSAYPHSRGGGMFNYNSHPTLRNCTFSYNSASEIGGGLYNEESSPSLTNCTFSGNSAQDGGGIINAYSQASIVNCTFSQNTASGNGGGMVNSYSNAEIINCTFFQNTAANHGGGVYNVFISPVIKNSIIYGNTGGNLDSLGVSPQVSYSLIQGGCTGEGNIDADPLLMPLAQNGGAAMTCAISAGSPAYAISKESGDQDWNGAPDKDQRGVARARAGLRAMGAYEAPRIALPSILLLLDGD
jgi:hypothetical protein